MKALAFGEILWDVYPDKRFIGGAPLNFAGHLARHGHAVSLLSAVGCDPLGAESLAELKRLGISERYVSVWKDQPTGRCVVSLGEDGVPTYALLQNVAYDCLAADGITEEFDLLYFGTLALRSSHNRRALQTLLEKKRFGEVFVDVNIRPPFYTKETVGFCAENATVLKISAEELPTVLEQLEVPGDGSCADIAGRLARKYKNLKLILLTLGEEGAFAWDAETGSACACPARTVQTVSAVGAGDSFSAAFISRRIKGDPIPDCLKYAADVAACVVSRPEAIPEYTPEDISAGRIFCCNAAADKK